MAVRYINICDRCGTKEESDGIWPSRTTPIGVTPIGVKGPFIQLCPKCSKEYDQLLKENEKKVKDWLGGQQ